MELQLALGSMRIHPPSVVRGEDSKAMRESRPYDIAVVILTWNSALCIGPCLDSLERAARVLRLLVCVVDNGSCDGTRRILETWGRRETHLYLETIYLDKNIGTTRSRNLGIRRVAQKAESLCILDSDTEITAEALLELKRVLAAHPSAGIVGPVLRGKDGSVQNSGRALPMLPQKILKVLPLRSLRRWGETQEEIQKPPGVVVPVGYLMSACWLMPMALPKTIGLLDENIFYAPEDVEYCLRAWKHGYAVLYDGKTSIVHEWQRISRCRLFSRHNWEHLKGLIYFFWKYRYCLTRPVLPCDRKGASKEESS